MHRFLVEGNKVLLIDTDTLVSYVKPKKPN